MIPAIISTLLLATRVISAPLLEGRQSTAVTVYIQPDPSNPEDITPITTLAPVKKEKRQDITFVKYVQNDPYDPNNMTPVSTWVQSGPSATPIPDQSQPEPEPELVPTTETTPVTDTSEVPTDNGSSNGAVGINDILSVINYWRDAYGVGRLEWGSDLEAAAANTGQLAGGDTSKMAHHPMDKQTAEVMGPGNDNAFGKDLQGHSPFEIAYLVWLCEVRSDTLGGLCDFQQSIMMT